MITYITKPADIPTSRPDNISYNNGSSTILPSQLSLECIQSPHGFVVTAFAFEEFLTYNSLHFVLHCLMQSLDSKSYSNLLAIADTARLLLLSGKMPPSLRRAIINAYHELGINETVVVHSHNFTADVDNLQAGINAEFGNSKTVSGETNLLEEVQNRFAGLYTGDAIKYRQNNNCVHDKAALSVTVQKMMLLPRSVEPGTTRLHN